MLHAIPYPVRYAFAMGVVNVRHTTCVVLFRHRMMGTFEPN